MSIKRIDTDPYVYFRYSRDRSGDFEDLKRQLVLLITHLTTPKDVIIDLSGLQNVSSSEVNEFVKLAKVLKDVHKRLRIVPNDKIKPVLDSVQIGKLECVVLYENAEAFVSEVRNSAGKAAAKNEEDDDKPPEEPPEPSPAAR